MSADTKTPLPKEVAHRVGDWLPKNHRILEKWLSQRIATVEARWKEDPDKPLHPVIHEFQTLIEGDPVIYMGFHQMFEQVPTKPPYGEDPAGEPQVRDYKLMLYLFDLILTMAPDWENNEHVGSPINAILDWPMGTPAGHSMFTNDKVNTMFKKILDVWAKFLTSPDSCYVLSDAPNGWFGPGASKAIPNFSQTFQCDPGVPSMGFKSWDDFFTRSFRDGARPIEGPDDMFITNACESTVYKVQSNVQERDKFWLKGQPYSLVNIFNYDKLASQFLGGTIYQAFLSSIDYHRWHAPVSGTVEKVVLVPGTYFADSPAVGMVSDGPVLSQSYMTVMATRALIFIRADYSPIGLMCFVAVGMGEVSTCEVTVQVGQHVKKGEQIGMFHFGGSTHCLIFRPETKVTFHPKVNDKVKLNAIVATVGPSDA